MSFSFGSLFKRKDDDEDEVIKFKQPRQPKMSVAPKYKEGRPAKEPTRIKIIQPKQDKLVDRVKTAQSANLDVAKDTYKPKNLWRDPFKPLEEKARSTERTLDAVVPPTPQLRARDVGREITRNVANIPTQGVKMMTESIPRSFTRAAMAIDERNYPRKALEKIAPETYKPLSERLGQQSGDFQYTEDLPLGIGKVNTPQDVRQNQLALGKSQTEANYRATLSTLGIGADILDFVPGAGQFGAGLKAGGTAMPFVMAGMKRVDIGDALKGFDETIKNIKSGKRAAMDSRKFVEPPLTSPSNNRPDGIIPGFSTPNIPISQDITAGLKSLSRREIEGKNVVTDFTGNRALVDVKFNQAPDTRKAKDFSSPFQIFDDAMQSLKGDYPFNTNPHENIGDQVHFGSTNNVDSGFNLTPFTPGDPQSELAKRVRNTKQFEPEMVSDETREFVSRAPDASRDSLLGEHQQASSDLGLQRGTYDYSEAAEKARKDEVLPGYDGAFEQAGFNETEITEIQKDYDRLSTFLASRDVLKISPKKQQEAFRMKREMEDILKSPTDRRRTEVAEEAFPESSQTMKLSQANSYINKHGESVPYTMKEMDRKKVTKATDLADTAFGGGTIPKLFHEDTVSKGLEDLRIAEKPVSSYNLQDELDYANEFGPRSSTQVPKNSQSPFPKLKITKPAAPKSIKMVASKKTSSYAPEKELSYVPEGKADYGSFDNIDAAISGRVDALRALDDTINAQPNKYKVRDLISQRNQIKNEIQELQSQIKGESKKLDSYGEIPKADAKTGEIIDDAKVFDEGIQPTRATRPEAEGKTGFFTPGSQELVNEKATGVNKLFNVKEEVSRTVKGKFDSFVKNVFGKTRVNKKSFGDAVKYIQGGRKGPVDESTKKVADGIRHYFMRAEEIAKEHGVDMGHIENYFPAMYNTDYLIGGKKVEESIRHLMDNGFAKTRTKAEDILKNFTEFEDKIPTDYKGRKQSFEKGRKITMPDDAYITDRGVLTLYAEKLSNRIGDVKSLGAGDENLVKAIDEAEELGGNRETIETIVDQHLKRNDWSKVDEAADIATRAVNIAALPFAGIKNAAQVQNVIAHGGVKNAVSGIKDATSKEGRAFAKEANAYNPEYLIQDSTENAPWLAERIAGATMSATEKALRTVSALAGRGKLKDLVEKSVKGISEKGTKEYELLVDDLYQIGLTIDELNGAVKGGITRDLELKSGRAFSDYTQFIINSLETPRKWRTPKGRLLSQYLSFAYKQSGLLRDAGKRAINGDVMPLVRYAIVAPPLTLGAAYATSKAKDLAFEGAKKLGVLEEDAQSRPAVPAYEEGDSKLKYGVDLATQAYGGVVGLPANVIQKGSRAIDTLSDERLTKGQKATRLVGSVSPTAGLAAGFVDAGLDVGATKKENVSQEEWKEQQDPYKALKREVVGTVPFAGEFANRAVPSLRYNSYKESLADDIKATASGKIKVKSDKPIGVSKTIDGDTIVIENGQTVRIDGINTPEMETAMGPQAANFTSNFVQGKDVQLVYDADPKGDFGREVIDVTVDGKSLAEELLKSGYARASTYGANSKNVEKYQALQKIAQTQKKGFWGDQNAQVELGEQGMGKDPSWWSKLTHLDRGKDKVDLNDKSIKEFEGMSASKAKTLSEEKKYNLNDEELLQVRAAADGYGEYFQGGKYNPSDKFDIGVNPLLDAYDKTDGKNISTKVAEVYGSRQYTEDEKNKLYSMMGFNADDAERAVLKVVKSDGATGIEEDAQFIYEYMSKKEFNVENVDKLFDEKTLTKTNIVEMYNQGLLSDEEAFTLGAKQAEISGKKFTLGDYVYKPSDKKDGTGKATRTKKGSKSSRKGKIKLTPYKYKTTLPEKTDYFSDLMGDMKAGPKIKVTAPPKADAIGTKFKVPSVKKPAKIKVKFNTGLI